MSNVQFTSITTDEGQQFITVLVNGRLQPPVDDTHPNFSAIKALCQDALDGEDVDTDHLIELFDVAETVRIKFERLSDRIAVKNGVITLDGDPVHGTLQEQILQFLDAGEDFAPLVEFYEKLLTNPLGDVRQGLYDWINGQRAEGNFTITSEGDILGYKAVDSRTPEWRTDESVVYVPSRRGEGVVNGRDVARDEYIEQVPGDVVEMPRSRVLHAPSQACGDGLHIGTYNYAKTFIDGGVVLLVKFSPRDIVSLPDSNSNWKLRVCRYTVVGPVDEPLDVPVWSPQGVEADLGWSSGEEVEPGEQADVDLTLPSDTVTRDFQVGDRVIDADGDEGVVEAEADEDDEVLVRYDDTIYGTQYVDVNDLTPLTAGFSVGDRIADDAGDEGTVVALEKDGGVTIEYDCAAFGTMTQAQHGYSQDRLTRIHGKGGPTSQATKGKGRNPAQDAKGRFSSGRPGSQRDSSTGRFVG